LDRADKFVFGLLIFLLIMLWIAGGASRADVAGQVVIRAAAWLVAIVWILFVPRLPIGRPHPVVVLLFAAILIVALQLVPLPPFLWTELPGRHLLAETATLIGEKEPWRPLSIAPGETVNALGSLIVPVTIFCLVANLSRESHRRLMGALLIMILAAVGVGAAQFSGAQLNHPLVNDVPGDVSAIFANRNHFALFVSLGCVLAPVYALSGNRPSPWAATIALGLMIVCLLMILAIGSRAGLLLAPLAIVAGVAITFRKIRDQLRLMPRRLTLVPIVGAAAVLAAVVVASLMADRAVSFDRFMSEGANAGLRAMIRPTVYEMIGKYFPFGTGFGTFDPAYRIDESTALLRPAYVNLAHNDLLQVALDGGLAGVALLVAALAWWAWASIRAWRPGRESLPRVGSAMLSLVIVASALDYPARTPMIMAITVIGAVWLALPSRNQG